MVRTRQKLALTVLALSLAMPSLAVAQTTGSVRFRVEKAGFILGVGGGTGVLVFRGKTYPVGVSGVSVGTIGVAHADLVGTAKNLRDASDIAGNYVATSAGIAAVDGIKTARLRNRKGVVLEVRGEQSGVEASLNLGAMHISMRPNE